MTPSGKTRRAVAECMNGECKAGRNRNCSYGRCRQCCTRASNKPPSRARCRVSTHNIPVTSTTSAQDTPGTGPIANP
ncbi:hypothetical protein FOMPIDRAFT_102074, partial [Fomitopsis schrenkii]